MSDPPGHPVTQMDLTAYRIENCDGDEVCPAVPSWDAATRLAQEHADRLGRSVYIWGPYADEGMEVGHLPASCCVNCGHPIEPGGPDDYDHRQLDRMRCRGRACVARDEQPAPAWREVADLL